MIIGKLASVNVVMHDYVTITSIHYTLISNCGHYNSSLWILDNGATIYICNDRRIFKDLIFQIILFISQIK